MGRGMIGKPGKMGKKAISGAVNRSVSNSGEMSSSTSRSGSTGSMTNTTNIRVQGDPGFTAGQESDAIKTARKLWGL